MCSGYSHLSDIPAIPRAIVLDIKASGDKHVDRVISTTL
jgi:hypothetical protein